MSDRDPIVLRRVLALRPFPVFGGCPLGELAVLAENATERTFAAGSPVDDPERRYRSFHLVVEGRIAARHDAALVWDPRDAYGILEALGHRRLPPAAAAVPTRTLELEASDFDDILEDNFGLLSALLRELAVRVAALSSREPDRARRHGVTAAIHGSDPLGLVERVIALRQLAPFATAGFHPLSMLARAATEVTWPAGTIVARAGEAAEHALIVVAGRLRATDGGALVLGPGDALGALETLGSFAHDTTIAAPEPVRVLELPGRKLLDVLEDHSELALSIVSTFAQTLLDAPVFARTN